MHRSAKVKHRLGLKGGVHVGANYRCWRKPQLAQRYLITHYTCMTRVLFWLVVSIAITTGACGGKTAVPATVPNPGAAGGSSAALVPATDGGVTKPPTKGMPGSAAGATCTPKTCVYHAGVAGYYNCLAGAAGACTHFGGSCTPADRCMFDAATMLHKNCTKPGDGTCEIFSASCNPAPGCWFDAKDGLFRRCTAGAGGACSKWGELCSPASTAE